MTLEFLTWKACSPAVWKLIRKRVVSSNVLTVEGVFELAGIPISTGYEMFHPSPRRVKFENVMRLLAVLELPPSWLDQFGKPVNSPKPAKGKAKRPAVKSR